ncbi:MAG TPA: hypothetical protein VGB42_04465 [Candidatus Thermoplasmatota archaeon]
MTVAASSCVGANVTFSLPGNATVTSARFDATLLVGSLAPSVGLNATLAGTAIVAANVTLLPGIPYEVWVSDVDINRELTRPGHGNQIDVAFDLCPAVGPFTIVFDRLNVTYWLRNPVPSLPALLPGSPLTLQAAAATGASIDLAPYFSDPEGDLLNYSATVAAAWDVIAGARALALANVSEAGIGISFSGSVAQLQATNPYWWGQALVRFSAQDPSGNLAGNGSEYVLVEVGASALAAANAHTYTESGGRGSGVDPSDCYSDWFVSITLPADAHITSFAMHADLYGDRPAFHGRIEVLHGSTVLASFEAAEMPLWVGSRALANLSGLVAYSGNSSNPGPFVDLDLTLSVCVNATATSGLLFTNISVTYWTGGVAPPYGSTPGGPGPGPGNGTQLPLPASLTLVLNGLATTTVESGSVLSLTATDGDSTLAAFNVSWFIDGILVGYGPALEGVTLPPGEHIIDVTVSNATVSRTFSTRVTASLPPGSPVPAWPLPALVGSAAIGMALAGTQAGRWLILGVVGGSVFARLKRDSLLDHFVRGTLYQVIREEPGVHFAELRRRAELSNGSASHHLRMLEKGGYVRVVIDGTRTRFFTTDRALDKEVYGISDTDKAVLDAVVGEPGIGQHDLKGRVNRSDATVSRSVARLVTLGYVTTTREGGKVLVYPRPGAELLDPLARPWPDEGD